MVQDGSLLESSCPFITEKLGEMEIESIQPYEMLSALPESARKRFYDMAGFDYDEFAALFDASPKKNLVIIGTSHGSEESARQQRDYVARIVEQYGEGYDIFFKPHPADTSSAGYEIEFPGLTRARQAVRDIRVGADRPRGHDRRLPLDGVPDGAPR